MKKNPTRIPLVAFSMFLMAGVAQADVQLGDVIKIDFGNIAPGTANWNQYNSTTGGSVALNRFSDGTSTGASITVTGVDGNFTNHFNGSAFGGSPDSTIYLDHIAGNGNDDDTLTITISGLDDLLTYDLFGGFLRDSSNWDHVWNVAGDIRTNQSVGGSINGYETFTGVLTTSPGQIQFTITDLVSVGGIASIGELTITASSTLDSDGDGLNDFWEDEHFGDNSGTVEPSDLTPQDGSGDGYPVADGDGLNNEEEETAGTDPNVADTDGDNLSDGDEVNTYFTNPTLADTDSDNIDDDKELAGQNQGGLSTGFGPTDPTLADSDLDGYDDDVELGAGTNPNDINKIPVVSLAAGTVIGIDFGADDGAPVNWNTLTAPGASVSVGSLTDLGGKFVDGVGFTTNAFAGSGENAGAHVSTSYPNIPDGAQGDWWFESNTAGDFVFTFSGLDDSLKYELLIGAYRLDLDPGQTELAASGWEVNGVQMATDPNDLDDSYVTFSGMTTDGAGNLTIRSYSVNGNHVNAVSALVLTVGSSGPQLKIASAANGTDLEFSWVNKAGKLYDIRRSTDLSTSPSTWPVWAADIPSDPSGTNIETYARPADPKSFFVLIEKDPPPITGEVFEADNGF